MSAEKTTKDKIYAIYRNRISLNVSEIKTKYALVHSFKEIQNGKTVYIFTVIPINEAIQQAIYRNDK